MEDAIVVVGRIAVLAVSRSVRFLVVWSHSSWSWWIRGVFRQTSISVPALLRRCPISTSIAASQPRDVDAEQVELAWIPSFHMPT